MLIKIAKYAMKFIFGLDLKKGQKNLRFKADYNADNQI